MNTFERELSKVFTDCKSIDNPTFVGSACYGDVAPNLKAKIQFVTMGRADYYEALRITMLNRTEGQVDVVTMRLSDLLGKKRTANFPEGVYPYAHCFLPYYCCAIGRALALCKISPWI